MPKRQEKTAAQNGGTTSAFSSHVFSHPRPKISMGRNVGRNKIAARRKANSRRHFRHRPMGRRLPPKALFLSAYLGVHRRIVPRFHILGACLCNRGEDVLVTR